MKAEDQAALCAICDICLDEKQYCAERPTRREVSRNVVNITIIVCRHN